MAFNLAQSIEARLTPDLINKFADATGEAPSKARAAMSVGGLAMTGALVQQGSTREGAAALISRLRADSPQASSLFGSQTAHLEGVVARASGVSPSSSSRVIALLAPIASSVLGREVMSRQLDAGGLSSMMLAEKKSLLARRDLPGGMSNLLVAEARPDIREVEVAPGRAARDVSVTEAPYARRPAPTAAVHRKASPWPLIIGAIALGGLLLAGIAALRGSQTASVPELPREAPVVRAPDINRPQPQIEPPAIPVPEPTSQTTTTGAEIAKPETPAAPQQQGEGIAAHFADTAPTGERFTLPGVTFEFGTTKLTGDGPAEIERMATAMKQHPSTRVRLEGHTDSVGNADVNKPLSYERAQAIKDMLVAQGVEPNRIETVGKRELDPVSENDTREGRAQNRRVDAVILSR